jgi:hypothetical protein
VRGAKSLPTPAIHFLTNRRWLVTSRHLEQVVSPQRASEAGARRGPLVRLGVLIEREGPAAAILAKICALMLENGSGADPSKGVPEIRALPPRTLLPLSKESFRRPFGLVQSSLKPELASRKCRPVKRSEREAGSGSARRNRARRPDAFWWWRDSCRRMTKKIVEITWSSATAKSNTQSGQATSRFRADGSPWE